MRLKTETIAVMCMGIAGLAFTGCGGDKSEPSNAGQDSGAATDGASTKDAAADQDSASAGDTATAQDTAGGCQPGSTEPPKAPYFTDISSASGIQVGNYVQKPAKSIPINDHSRLGFVDLNGDGLDDIVTHSLYPNPKAGVPFEHLVYLNLGDGTFKDISSESGLRDVQAGFFAFGDVDNDGDQDCFAGLDVPLRARPTCCCSTTARGSSRSRKRAA